MLLIGNYFRRADDDEPSVPARGSGARVGPFPDRRFSPLRAACMLRLTMKKASRDIEKIYSRRQFVEKLRRLADALETESAFTIQVAGERLRIPASATFNIEHEREGGEHELEFQLRWIEGPAKERR